LELLYPTTSFFVQATLARTTVKGKNLRRGQTLMNPSSIPVMSSDSSSEKAKQLTLL
jgi:hypothetical protein